MSGIIGIAQFDGSPLEPSLLGRLVDSLAFRGPDHQQIWTKHNVGLGHTLFKTTEESEYDSQPLTLDGRTWIVADARIDARRDLVTALKAAGLHVSQSNWTDAELILRAYKVWGIDCVQHLLGDFAFGIWDDARQLLFCARDHMGVKPFYYSQVGTCVIFSNTLDCIRRHPFVSDKLNDLAIADFLLFGFNQDSTTTSFAEIQRLPPAHRAMWSQGALHLDRYWSMPIDEPLFYNRPDDYTGHFRDLLRKCVADRLRTNRAWIFMSGGIDSPTLAVAARDLLRGLSPTFQLRALTQVDSFVPDECHYATLVANRLGIPIDYRHWAEMTESDWEQVPFSLPEPNLEACLIPSERRFWSQIQGYSRVFLYGEGPDNALILDWQPYVMYLLRRKKYGLLARNVLSTILSEKSPPFWGRLSRRIKINHYAADNVRPAYPDWLNPQLESRLQLRERWHTAKRALEPYHPIRPKGYASLQIPRWQTMFEGFDFSVSKASFEVRHPFADIRMLRFLLAVPPLPWCRGKYLLRKSMDSSLPKEILRRRKTTPQMSLFRRFLANLCQAPFLPTSEIREFVNVERFLPSATPDNAESNLGVRSLNHWLQNSYPSSHNLKGRIACDRFA